MNGSATRIDRSHACWRCYCNLLDTVLPDIFQKSSFTGTCFACKKNIAVAFVHQAGGKLKHFIVAVEWLHREFKVRKKFYFDGLAIQISFLGIESFTGILKV